MLRNSKLFLIGLLIFNFSAAAQTISPIGGGGGSGSQFLAPIAGFSCANAAAQNTAAFNAAVAAGQIAFSIKNCATPYKTNAPMVITNGMSLVGEVQQVGGGPGSGVIIQPPTNTVGIQAVGAGIWVQNITVQYASPEPIANTGAIGFLMGNSSQFLFYSNITDVVVTNSNTAFSTNNGSTFGEFQNTFNGIRAQKFSKFALAEFSTNSGSVFNNTRFQNEIATPTATDCTSAISMINAFNVIFNTLNVEFMDCTNSILNIQQSSITFNGLHFEQIVQGNFANLIDVDFQNTWQINNFSIQNSTFNGTSSSIFNFFANGSASGGSTVTVNGFTELGNTFTTTLPWFTDDGNFNSFYLKGSNPRNTANVVITSRNDLVQVGAFLFDSPGGKVIAGCSVTTPPTTGMPLPFATTAGVALPWSVGDRCNNSAPTATSTTGWRNTTAGSPGTFTPEPIL